MNISLDTLKHVRADLVEECLRYELAYGQIGIRVGDKSQLLYQGRLKACNALINDIENDCIGLTYLTEKQPTRYNLRKLETYIVWHQVPGTSTALKRKYYSKYVAEIYAEYDQEFAECCIEWE